MYVQYFDFLGSFNTQYLINAFIHNQIQAQFTASTTATNDKNWRRSKVTHGLPEPLNTLFQHKLNERLPSALHSFSRVLTLPRPIQYTEIQVTVSGNGDFYKRHADNGDELKERVLTFVYYFYRLPKSFEGGNLRIFSSRGFNVQVEPVFDSIVFFPSYVEHEVMPVSSSGRWEDSRFTVNGWFRI